MHSKYLFVPLTTALFLHTLSSQAQPLRAEDRTAQAPPADVATRLVIDSNAACTLRVNGRLDDMVLIPGTPRSVEVSPGDVVVECASATVPTATVRHTANVAQGTKALDIKLDVATPVVKATCNGQAATLADLGHGVLRHCVTGVDWTQRDSGPGGLVWVDAFDYCAKKGSGWVVPEPDELAELIDRTGKSQTSCGKHTCNVSPKFRFASPIFWSNEKTHEGMHMIVNLILGGRHPTADDANFEYHTLCIRRPPRT